MPLPPNTPTPSADATESTVGEGVSIQFPELVIPNPVQDVVELVQGSREVIARGAWVAAGVALIGLGIVGILFAGIRNEVIDVAYNPAKERIKDSIRGRKK